MARTDRVLGDGRRDERGGMKREGGRQRETASRLERRSRRWEGERRMIVSMITMERKRKRDGGGGWPRKRGVGSNLLALT